ncbi:hypothetical protein ABTY96_17825 [Streptomyces sp. NPDC096057]|uniref:hypothetical protein n=1 Tax=Streptomyces sp. NPDC096057 TaxID=3155543 RepID=UPI0033205E77
MSTAPESLARIGLSAGALRVFDIAAAGDLRLGAAPADTRDIPAVRRLVRQLPDVPGRPVP